jgi:hypothetical protein
MKSTVIGLGIVVLQNCMDLLKVEPGSYSETCLVSSHDGNQEVTSLQEEDPLLMFPVIKAEHQVSCVHVFFLSIVLHISQIFRTAYSHLCLACPST